MQVSMSTSSNQPPEITYNRPGRPFGVTIIGALEIIAGIIGILSAGFIFLASGISGAIAGGFAGGVAGFLAGLFFGGLAFIIGLITLAVGVGLLRGRGWAWTVAVIISFISILIGVFDVAGGSIKAFSLGFLGSDIFGGLASVAISLVVLLYLYRPHVKAFFSKG